MRKLALPPCLLGLLLFATFAAGQSDAKKDLEGELKKDLEGKMFTLSRAFGGGILKIETILQTVQGKTSAGDIRVEINDVGFKDDILLRKEFLEVRATRVCLSVDPDRPETPNVARGGDFRIRLELPEPFDPEKLRTALKQVFLPFDRAGKIPLRPPRSQPPTVLGDKPVYTIKADDVEPPRCVSCPTPESSPEARRERIGGVVVMWVVIDEKGDVVDAGFLEPAACGLDDPALETVKTWKFKPALRKGQPVPVSMRVEVDFHFY